MPTGPKSQKRPADAISNAVKVMRIGTEEELEEFRPAKPEKNEVADEMGRRSAASRAAKLSLEQRVEIARNAAVKR